MKQADDQDIIQLFAQGASKREQAFVLLTTKYGDRLYHQIFRYVRNSEDSNDVLQNVLIKIYRNLENFKGDSALYTWMYQIARNESLNFI